MKRWLLTIWAAFALAMADRAGTKAHRWMERAKRANAKIREMEQ